METAKQTTKDVKKTKQPKQVKQQQQEVKNQESQPEQQIQTEKPIQTEQPEVLSEPEQKEIRLVDIAIENENVALNVMVGFLNLAHKRGIFTIDESAKIWECILKFQRN
jgi:hypothetical protein